MANDLHHACRDSFDLCIKIVSTAEAECRLERLGINVRRPGKPCEITSRTVRQAQHRSERGNVSVVALPHGDHLHRQQVRRGSQRRRGDLA
jgi:hypothetical protein